jgi:hypothetical protein
MKLKRLLASAMVVVTGALGLTVAAAGPAAAAAGSWKPYGTTNPIESTVGVWVWVCGSTSEITTDVFAQVCAVRIFSRGLPTDTVRSAVIVRNNKSGMYNTSAKSDLSNHATNRFIDRWACASSGIATRTWSVCFGQWINNSPNERVVARGDANLFSLSMSQQL